MIPLIVPVKTLIASDTPFMISAIPLNAALKVVPINPATGLATLNYNSPLALADKCYFDR